jgi:hypothetical protein
MSDEEYARLQSAFVEINKRFEEIDVKQNNIELTVQTLLRKIQSMQLTVTNLISKIG